LSSKKIGVLGGSFSPVHNGHIFLAKYVKENCGLDKVLMIPTGVHPFECKRNKNIPDAEHRLNMLKLAVEGENGIEISDIELKSAEVSYTYVTLCKLREIYGEKCRIYFVIGTDELLDLEKWYEYEKLIKEFSFIVGIRPHYENSKVIDKARYLNERFGAHIEIIDLPAPDVSSTEVREAIAEKTDLAGLVPETVNEYIKLNNLYL